MKNYKLVHALFSLFRIFAATSRVCGSSRLPLLTAGPHVTSRVSGIRMRSAAATVEHTSAPRVAPCLETLHGAGKFEWPCSQGAAEGKLVNLLDARWTVIDGLLKARTSRPRVSHSKATAYPTGRSLHVVSWRPKLFGSKYSRALGALGVPQKGEARYKHVLVGKPNSLLRGQFSDSRSRVRRRIFDSPSVLGVGVPEAVVIGFVGWFVLGPEELYRLAKRIGGWLGELRSYVGQVAQQYESTLDDESTRKAIQGIRETQKTVLEVGSSWSSVAESFRDPLALGSTFESTYKKYAEKPDAVKQEREQGEEGASGAESANKEKNEKKARAESANKEKKAPPGTYEEELNGIITDLEATPEELASSDDSPATLRGDRTQAYRRVLVRLDGRLDELDEMSSGLEELRAGILEDREAIRKAVGLKDSALAPSQGQTLEERQAI